jgi:hypothetical protein
MQVEDRLLEFEERKRLKHIQAVQRQNREAREQAGRGVTNSSAASIAASSNRLYHAAQKKKQEDDERLEREASAPRPSNYFQPTINKTSQKLAQRVRPQHVSVEDSLAYRGQVSSHKAEVRQRNNEQQAIRLASEYKINPTSERILREGTNRRGGGDISGYEGTGTTASSTTRISKPIGALNPKSWEGVEEPTFQPKLLSSSSKASSSQWARDRDQSTATDDGGGGDMYNRSQKWLKQKQMRLERERKAKETSELQQCSFRPQIADRNPHEYDIGSGSGFDAECGGGLSISERQAEWATKR